MVKELGLVTESHPHPYSLGWFRKDVELRITKRCVLKFAVTSQFVDEVTCEVVPLDICQVMFGNSYLYDRDALYHRRAQKYVLSKDGKTFVLEGTGSESPTSLVAITQAKRLFQAGHMLTLLVREMEPEGPLGEVVAKELAEGARKQATESMQQRAELRAIPCGLTPRQVIGHSMALAKGVPLPRACRKRHLWQGRKRIEDKHCKTFRIAGTQPRLSTSGTSFVCGEETRVLPTACLGYVKGSDFRKKALDCKGSRGTSAQIGSSKPGLGIWAETRGHDVRAGRRLKMFEPSVYSEDGGCKAYPHLWA